VRLHHEPGHPRRSLPGAGSDALTGGDFLISITLFAFDTGEDLSEHTAPFDALVLTLSGSLTLTIGGRRVVTTPQSLVLMPANVPHAVHAIEASRMLLIMLREQVGA
jgi:quercetin dioxygenase-like cupin family protein